MMLTNSQCEKLASYSKNYIISKFDPTFFVEILSDNFNLPHEGFYISIEKANGDLIAREGFLLKDQTDVLASLNNVCSKILPVINNQKISITDLKVCTFYFTLIHNHHYTSDPLNWNKDSDGVFFMWGQDYKGIYLPHQLKKMSYSKPEILDRLCCLECGLISNLWKTPEGLVFRLSCQSFIG